MEWQNTTCSNSKQTFSLKKKVNLRKEEAVETIVTIAREMLNFQRPTDPIAIKLSRKWTYKLRNFLDAAINLHSEQPLFKRAYFLPVFGHRSLSKLSLTNPELKNLEWHFQRLRRSLSIPNRSLVCQVHKLAGSLFKHARHVIEKRKCAFHSTTRRKAHEEMHHRLVPKLG